jgi:hypothetical protein
MSLCFRQFDVMPFWSAPQTLNRSMLQAAVVSRREPDRDFSRCSLKQSEAKPQEVFF